MSRHTIAIAIEGDHTERGAALLAELGGHQRRGE